jgi:hypothetical protein
MRRWIGIDHLTANLGRAGPQGDRAIQHYDPAAGFEQLSRHCEPLPGRSVVEQKSSLVAGPWSVRHVMVTFVKINRSNYIIEPPADQSAPTRTGASTQELAP